MRAVEENLHPGKHYAAILGSAFQMSRILGCLQAGPGDWLRCLRRCLSRSSSNGDRRQKEGRSPQQPGPEMKKSRMALR